MGSFVEANTFLDAERTAANREAARRSVEPIQGTIRAGESIVREGEIVSPLALEKLQVLGLLSQDVGWLDVAGSAAFALCLVAMLVAYVSRAQPTLLDRPRRQLLLLLTLVTAAAGVRLAVPGHVLAPYLFPAASAAMLVAALLNLELGVVVAALMGILVGADSGGILQLIVYSMSAASWGPSLSPTWMSWADLCALACTWPPRTWPSSLPSSCATRCTTRSASWNSWRRGLATACSPPA
jgi:membrane-associated HD superfamily phosphohydrolase